mmetsp:Transcript_13062/g.20281  ORF Transcript_13062/g.20281 Transcript_13062/m.20281 type:complete len:133 (+) Transcript_13062:445-843(+)
MDTMMGLKGEDFAAFINGSIVEKNDIYEVKDGIVHRPNADQGTEVADYASYAYHQLTKMTTKLDKEAMQIVFADMTPEQITTSFIKSFGLGEEGEAKRKQLEEELHLSVLMDTAGWLSDNLRYGCVMCAPFL